MTKLYGGKTRALHALVSAVCNCSRTTAQVRLEICRMTFRPIRSYNLEGCQAGSNHLLCYGAVRCDEFATLWYTAVELQLNGHRSLTQAHSAGNTFIAGNYSLPFFWLSGVFCVGGSIISAAVPLSASWMEISGLQPLWAMDWRAGDSAVGLDLVVVSVAPRRSARCADTAGRCTPSACA